MNSLAGRLTAGVVAAFQKLFAGYGEQWPDNAANRLLDAMLGEDWMLRGTRNGTRPDNVFANGRVWRADPVTVQVNPVRVVLKDRRGRPIETRRREILEGGKVAHRITEGRPIYRGMDKRTADKLIRDRLRASAGRHVWHGFTVGTDPHAMTATRS